MALDPRLKIIAPWREWEIRSREDAIAYAAKHNVPVTATISKSIAGRAHFMCRYAFMTPPYLRKNWPDGWFDPWICV